MASNRTPPTSPESEMVLLGAMILEPRIIPDVAEILNGPDDFAAAKHSAIYRAILAAHAESPLLDITIVVNGLRADGLEEQVGGAAYLVELASAVASAETFAHHARQVAEHAKLRRLLSACAITMDEVYRAGPLGADGAREILDAAEMRVFDLAQEQTTNASKSLCQLLDEEARRMEEAAENQTIGLRTGFAKLDKWTGGFQPGDLIILAARPSVGKTAMALNLAEQIAMLSGGAVGVFSMEMAKRAVVQRMLAARSGVSMHKIRGGNRALTDAELRSVMVASAELKHLGIVVDDQPGLTLMNLRARGRKMVARHKCKALFVDYLQLMTAPGSAESRQVEVSAISRGIKSLAREMDVPIVCLSQLNRASEMRAGNRPRMSDLRESGSIEQDADVVLLLHREGYYAEPSQLLDNPALARSAELIVAKQRNGETGSIVLDWDAESTRFRDGAQAPAASCATVPDDWTR